jgi:hypothetical protein
MKCVSVCTKNNKRSWPEKGTNAAPYLLLVVNLYLETKSLLKELALKEEGIS